MSYYLQMDGVDDVVYYNSFPSNFTVDEVVIDCLVTSHKEYTKYTSLSHSGFLQFNGDVDQFLGVWTNVEVDGVICNNNTVFVPLNKRIKIRLTGTATINNEFSVFAANGSGYGALGGNLYSATLKNNGFAVAYYDMTTGTVQDQSGNGRHAILTGGTWVSDAPSGTLHTVSSNIIGVTTTDIMNKLLQFSSMSATGISSLITNPNLITKSSVSIQGAASVTANTGGVQTSSVAIQGVSAASLTSVLKTYLNATINGISDVQAYATITHKVATIINGVGQLIIINGKAILHRITIVGKTNPRHAIKRAKIRGEI